MEQRVPSAMPTISIKSDAVSVILTRLFRCVVDVFVITLPCYFESFFCYVIPLRASLIILLLCHRVILVIFFIASLIFLLLSHYVILDIILHRVIDIFIIVSSCNFESFSS